MTSIFESNAPLDGERATSSVHRRVELQSPLDLSYLIANVQKAAQEKIDKHLPPDAAVDGEDQMRKRVELLVDGYIRNTFNAAKDSMSINGMDSHEMEAELAKAQEGEETEPFDAKLAQRIQALSAQIEHQTLQLANLRRTAPAQTAKRFEETFAKQTREENERLEKGRDVSLEEAKATKVDVDGIERLDEMRDTWLKGTGGLEQLKNGMGGTIAEMERAQTAVQYVGGKR